MISFHEIETLTLLIITLASQFVYLLWGQHLFSMYKYCLKCESNSRHLQPIEGPIRGLFRYCENIADLPAAALVWTLQAGVGWYRW